MTNSQKTDLINKAKEAAKNAYSPYSGFKVGAALLCSDGEVYVGSNVENSSFSATNCAERIAIQTAVSKGKRDFLAIAIVGGKENLGESIVPPCGICRQVMYEFCDPYKFVVILAKNDGYEEYLLNDILPLAFSKENL